MALMVGSFAAVTGCLGSANLSGALPLASAPEVDNAPLSILRHGGLPDFMHSLKGIATGRAAPKPSSRQFQCELCRSEPVTTEPRTGAAQLSLPSSLVLRSMTRGPWEISIGSRATALATWRCR
jgi:hypothetical protein